MHSILGIDTVGPLGSIALLVDGTIVGEAPLPPGGHSSGLAAAADAVARKAGVGLATLTGIAVSGGPGSFTGLRIGFAWAKGVALAAGVRLAVVSAHAAGDVRGLRITVTPGERKELALAVWAAPSADDLAAGRPVPLAAPRSVPEWEVSEAVAALAEDRPFMAIPTSEALAAFLAADGVPHIAPRPLAGSVARLGDALLRANGAADLASASPAYGRAPNARKPAR